MSSIAPLMQHSFSPKQLNYKHAANYLAHNEFTTLDKLKLPTADTAEMHTIFRETDSFNYQNRITDDGMAAGPTNGDHIASAHTGSLNSATSLQSVGPNTPIHDSGATNTIFRQSDSNSLDNIRPDVGMTVGLPNGDSITSAAVGILSNSRISIPVPVFSDKSLNRSLIATADFCNNGCTATFTATSATITHDATGDIIAQSSKLPSERLWPFDLHSTVPVIHNVVRHEINADFVAYSSATFFSPPDTSLAHALTSGWLGNFPRLTAAMLLANKPNSIATAKGHLQQSRQKNHSSTYTASPQRVVNQTILTSLPDHVSDDNTEPLTSDFDQVFTHLSTRTEFLNSSDMPGRFTHVSYRGYEYVLISVFRGYIHAEPLKSRQQADLLSAYRDTYSFFKRLGHSPQFQMLDNEDSTKLKHFFRDEAKVEVQYVPPNTHRRNRAERAIRDWKAHFISGLANVDKDFLMYLWCELLQQAELTLNHLRPYLLDPSLSAYEGIFGTKFDFLAHPIHPPGTKVLVLDPVATRQSWAPHGLLGFYLGPALQHYKSFRTYIVSTRGFRISDSLSWHPEKLHLPGSTTAEIIFYTAEKLLNELSSHSDTDTTVLEQLANDMHILVKKFSTTESSSEQRVVTPTTLTSLPPAPAPSAPLLEIPHSHEFPLVQYTSVSRAQCPKQHQHFFNYIGKTFTDTDDGLHFQITKIVTLRTSHQKHPTLFFRYFDTSKFSKAPSNEKDYENTPCSEFVKKRKSTGIHFSPPFIIWDTPTSSAGSATIFLRLSLLLTILP